MTTYFRWIARGPDLVQARVEILQVSAAPRTAYWIFDMSGAWKPSTGISDDRVLVAITFTNAGARIIGDQARWVRFPTPAFRGEARHPSGIIVKSNEPGAYGIGAEVLKELNNGHVKETRLADLREMAKALGKPTAHAQQRMRLQRWD
jgi:hypothetical protein